MQGGYQRRTTNGVIGISGQPVRVYSVHVTSGATAGQVALYDGTDTTGTKRMDADGKPNETAFSLDMPAGGMYFPAGCFVGLDANATAVVVEYAQVISR